MAILQPNWLQTGSYSAKKDRRVMSAAVVQEGIVRKGHYALAQRGAGANMSVDVAAGEAWVKGDSAIDQGYYHVVNDATVNVPLSAANASNPRIDAIVLAVNDSTEIGGADSYLLEAIAGTATAGATLANLKGAPAGVAGPAISATKLLLGYVLVPAAATSVTTGNMGGLRDPKSYNAELGLTKAEAYAVAGAPAQYAHGRPLDWVPSIRAERAAAQTYTNLNVISLLFDTEIWDTEEMHSLASEQAKVIIKTPGIWHYDHVVHFNAAGNGIADVKINAAEDQKFKVANSGTLSADAMIFNTLRLGYGDVVEFCGFFNGSATTFTGQSVLTWQGP